MGPGAWIDHRWRRGWPMLPVAALAMPILAMGPLAARASEAEAGRALAERLCATCHMGEGQGEKQGPMGVPGFKAVARREGQSEEAIVRWLRSKPPMMPDHQVTLDEAYALAAFIMSLRSAP